MAVPSPSRQAWSVNACIASIRWDENVRALHPQPGPGAPLQLLMLEDALESPVERGGREETVRPLTGRCRVEHESREPSSRKTSRIKKGAGPCPQEVPGA